MKYYLNACDDYNEIKYQPLREMLENKPVLNLPLGMFCYDCIELTLTELKYLNENLIKDYGMDESEYPYLELDGVDDDYMIFNFGMINCY